MTTWPDPERLLIARYLAGLGLRSTELCGILGDEVIRRRGLPVPG